MCNTYRMSQGLSVAYHEVMLDGFSQMPTCTCIPTSELWGSVCLFDETTHSDFSSQLAIPTLCFLNVPNGREHCALDGSFYNIEEVCVHGYSAPCFCLSRRTYVYTNTNTHYTEFVCSLRIVHVRGHADPVLVIITVHMYAYHILSSKRPWALEIDRPNNGGWALHRQAICMYDAYMHES